MTLGLNYYSPTHIIGSSGGNTDDMAESLDLMGKKLIYTNIEMELTAIEDFKKKGRTNPLFAKLAEITKRNNGLWSAETENICLKIKINRSVEAGSFEAKPPRMPCAIFDCFGAYWK